MSRRRTSTSPATVPPVRRHPRCVPEPGLVCPAPTRPPTEPEPAPLPARPARLSAPRRPRRPRRCTVSYTHYPGTHDHGGDQLVPHLRLSGLWLEQLGFAIGTKLRITAQEGCLLIETLL